MTWGSVRDHEQSLISLALREFVAFLPSTFTMYTTMLAFTFALPLASNNPFGITRSWRATFFFCLGPILGWPFVGLMALPFIFEQCALRAGDVAKKEEMGGLLADRTRRLIGAGILSVVLISVSIDRSSFEAVIELNRSYYHASDPHRRHRLVGLRTSRLPQS
jgi:hypothetical protein